MSRSPPVLIVGGGATGTGIARDLALRGVDVALAERNGLSSGASGRSHGLLHSGARYAEADRAGARACLRENRLLRSIAGECLRETGGLFVQLPEDDAGYFDEKRAACEAVGIETTVLDGAEARDSVAGLSADVERAMRVPDGVVRPSRLCAANAASAERNGATIYPHAPLEDLTVDDGRVTTATLGGTVSDTRDVEFVVNAAGPWAGQVAELAGVTLDMALTRGVMVAVEHSDLGPVLNRCRSPDDGDIVVPHAREAVLGTTSVPVADPDEYERAAWEVERSIEECAAMLPPVADAPVVRTWWGVRPLYESGAAEGEERGISRDFFTLDHAADGVDGLVSVVGGKLTTYRRMAEATANLVCERLGVTVDCSTAERALYAADDADRLDELVATYDSSGPADADVVGDSERDRS